MSNEQNTQAGANFLTNDQIAAGATIECDHGAPIGRNVAIDVFDAMRAAAPVAAQAGQVAVPEGYALVPVALTSEMKAAGGHVNSEWLNDNAPIGESRYAMPMAGVWAAMLAAAPSAPVVAQQAPADWISVEATEPPERELIALRYWPYDNRENPQAVTGGRYIDGTFYNDEGNELHPPSHWCRLPHFDAEATVQASTPDGRQEGGDRG